MQTLLTCTELNGIKHISPSAVLRVSDGMITA